MTPRINDTWFSEALLEQLKQKKSSYQMDGLGAISDLTHPAILKCEHSFQHAQTELKVFDQIAGYSFLTFKEKPSNRGNVLQIGGLPWQIGQFLEQKPEEALIHFGSMGSILVSQRESFAPFLVPELHHYTLPLWLDYALSAELWGPAGKWSRFHERLHTLFAVNGLLIAKDFPGYYPLKKEAQWLTRYGFQGLQNPDSFVLIPKWDFPLSGLVELEKVLARGP